MWDQFQLAVFFPRFDLAGFLRTSFTPGQIEKDNQSNHPDNDLPGHIQHVPWRREEKQTSWG
jgi:hypothetical protein